MFSIAKFLYLILSIFSSVSKFLIEKDQRRLGGIENENKAKDEEIKRVILAANAGNIADSVRPDAPDPNDRDK